MASPSSDCSTALSLLMMWPIPFGKSAEKSWSQDEIVFRNGDLSDFESHNFSSPDELVELVCSCARNDN